MSEQADKFSDKKAKPVQLLSFVEITQLKAGFSKSSEVELQSYIEQQFEMQASYIEHPDAKSNVEYDRCAERIAIATQYLAKNKNQDQSQSR